MLLSEIPENRFPIPIEYVIVQAFNPINLKFVQYKT